MFLFFVSGLDFVSVSAFLFMVNCCVSFLASLVLYVSVVFLALFSYIGCMAVGHQLRAFLLWAHEDINCAHSYYAQWAWESGPHTAPPGAS